MTRALIYCEVVRTLDAFVFFQVRVLVKALPAQMALSCVVLDKDADEYTRLLGFFFLLFWTALVRPTGTSPV